MSLVTRSDILKTEMDIVIKTPLGKIAGLTWGDQENPPVLLVHGKLHASSCFRPLVSLLPTSFYYVAIDLPGNGRSEHLPKGLHFSILDLIPAIFFVVKHFKWTKFIYIGHSLGSVVGKYFNITYPGYISRVVELDPIPSHHNWRTEDLNKWYQRYYDTYYMQKYEILNGVGKGPTYTYNEVMELMKKIDVNEAAAKHLLDRILEPAEDGRYRFSYDQRCKDVITLPFSGELLRQIYTATKTPTFCVLASTTLKQGIFDRVPFVKDETAWPNIKYKFIIVDGNHNVHLNNPELMADDISKFMMEDFGAKL